MPLSLRLAFACLALPIALLAGCGGDEDASPASTAPARKTPTPYDPSPAETPPAALDAAAVTAALPGVLELFTSIDPDHHRAVYESFLADDDGTCPGATSYPEADGSTTVYWQNDCTTASGTRFLGGAYLTTFTGRVNDDGSLSDGFTLTSNGSDATILRADGSSFTLNGYFEVSVAHAADASYSYGYVYMDASFEADAASAGGDAWLTGERKGLLVVAGYGDTNGTRVASFQAGLSLGEGQAFVAASTDQIDIDPTRDCPSEPVGGLSVRDPEGTWYDVRFDANPPEDGDPAGECDGCGVVLAGGREIGQACPPADAFAGVLDFQEVPW